MIKHMTGPQGKKHGFTLIELLVVIAILAILIAIVVPLTNKVKDFSEDADCKARIRNIAIGMMSYYDDHQEFPNSQYWVGKSAGRHHSGVWAEWAYKDNIQAGTLWKYVGSEKSYICPTFLKVYKRNPTFANIPAYASYSMNEYFNPAPRDANGNFIRGSWQHSGLNLFHGMRNEVRFASSMALIGEESTWRTPHSNYPLNNLALGVGSLPNGKIDGIASFHKPLDPDMQEGHSNVAFFDLHVASHHNSESKALFTPWVIKDAMNWNP